MPELAMQQTRLSMSSLLIPQTLANPKWEAFYKLQAENRCKPHKQPSSWVKALFVWAYQTYVDDPFFAIVAKLPHGHPTCNKIIDASKVC